MQSTSNPQGATMPSTSSVPQGATLPSTSNGSRGATLPSTSNGSRGATLPSTSNGSGGATLPSASNITKDATLPTTNRPKGATLPLTSNNPQNFTLPLVANNSQNGTLPLVANNSQNGTLPLASNNPQNATPIPTPNSQQVPILPPQIVTLPSTSSSGNPQETILPSTPNHVQEANDGRAKQEKIIIRMEGIDLKYKYNHGVVVSADNEIFVTDYFNKRIQVYSMVGTRTRLFKTMVPNENGKTKSMLPCDIAKDEQGHLWALGKVCHSYGPGHVVQYSLGGQSVRKFDLQALAPYPHIAVDARNDKIIVVNNDVIMMFHPNGSLYRSFREQQEQFKYVTSDKEGNILVTTYSHHVRVYNHTGQLLLKFGGCGTDQEKLMYPEGILTDALGRIIVASWQSGQVDMFTSRGEFIRTVVNMARPEGIALGPGGQLVVTTSGINTTTIFPRKMELP
ncbi:tripartite motif-containing protein 3-like [Branchiostoma lanceolatum]|uniref:tripartite motif-containing protein 3-like n=1 Tax=Branchiostoma lanceolatum TaxID=7740 RepID=UPI00345670B9